MEIIITASVVAIIGAIISFISMLISLKQAHTSKKNLNLQEKIYNESRPNFRIADILDSYSISNRADDTTKMMFYPLITNLSDKPMTIEKIRLKVVGENDEITLTPVIEDSYMYDGYNISANNSMSQWVCFEIKNNIQKTLKIIKYILIIEDAYKNADTKTVIWLKEVVNTDEKKSQN